MQVLEQFCTGLNKGHRAQHKPDSPSTKVCLQGMAQATGSQARHGPGRRAQHGSGLNSDTGSAGLTTGRERMSGHECRLGKTSEQASAPGEVQRGMRTQSYGCQTIEVAVMANFKGLNTISITNG